MYTSSMHDRQTPVTSMSQETIREISDITGLRPDQIRLIRARRYTIKEIILDKVVEPLLAVLCLIIPGMIIGYDGFGILQVIECPRCQVLMQPIDIESQPNQTKQVYPAVVAWCSQCGFVYDLYPCNSD